ncbi:hypothetical protein GJ496_000799 [Pomphorhynchus laevis]|nr:hypothetical protein GJ496_000799 [Pomphorhynchus laevis]
MAATEAEVAVGSTVGHVAADSLLGDRSEGTSVEQLTPQTELSANPCYDSINNFLRCIEENNDVSMCQGFSEVLKECKARHGLSSIKFPRDGSNSPDANYLDSFWKLQIT